LPTEPPYAIFAEHCRRGELAHEVAPGEWRASSGVGTVYATTVAHPRGGEPYNVALVELDEGFRIMSRVEGVAPDEVRVGMRVSVRFDGSQDPPLPVFDPCP
jgi:uncharacterized OB-fold protein